LFTLITISGIAQERSKKESKKDMGPLNTVTVSVGRASDISKGFKVSSVGSDYLRRFHPKWEWGIQLDLDFETGFVDFEGIQLAGIMAYSITKKWPVFGGVAIAKEQDELIASLRLGTEYAIYLDKAQKFFISPGTFLDINADNSTFSAVFAVGMVW